MSLIIDSYMRYPLSWIYAALGGIALIVGILTIDGFIEASEGLLIIDVYGMCFMFLSAFLIMSAYLTYRIDRVERRLKKEP